MNKIKLVAIDVDNTLLTSQQTIPVNVREAIAEAQQTGVVVTLATGRMYESARPFAREINISAPIITYNGALIQDMDGNTLFQQALSKEYTLQLIEVAKQYGYTLNIYVNDRLYVEEHDEGVEFYLSIAHVGVNEVGDLTQFVQGLSDDAVILKCLFVTPTEKTPQLAAELQQKYHSAMEVVISHPRFIECTAKDISKGIALKALCRHYDIALENAMAIGDNYNDITMLQTAGIGVAVSNAPEEVKQAADYTVASCDEGGVAEAFHRFVFQTDETTVK